MADALIGLEHVSVRFGAHTAVHDISYTFASNPGIIGLIGPNGAGKTTLISTLFGLTPLSAGTIRKGTTNMAFCADTPEFNPYLTATEVLQEAVALHGGAHGGRREAQRILRSVGLQEHDKTYVGNYSRGMKQRLGIAAAMILHPDILFLDEPTSALDPFGREAVLQLIGTIAQTIPVVFSSHILDDEQRVAHQLIVLDKGRMLYSGDLSGFLAADDETSTLQAESPGAALDIAAQLTLEHIDAIVDKSNRARISFPTSRFDDAWAALTDKTRLIDGVERRPPVSLREAFATAIQADTNADNGTEE